MTLIIFLINFKKTAICNSIISWGQPDFFFVCLLKSRSVLRDDEPPWGAADDGPSHHRTTHAHLHRVSITQHFPVHSSHPWSYRHDSLPTCLADFSPPHFLTPSPVTSQWIGCSLSLPSLIWNDSFCRCVYKWQYKKKKFNLKSISIVQNIQHLKTTLCPTYLPSPETLVKARCCSMAAQTGEKNFHIRHNPAPIMCCTDRRFGGSLINH